MKKNKAFIESTLLILILVLLIVGRWNLPNDNQKTVASQEGSKAGTVVNKVPHTKLTQENQELPPLLKYEKNYLPWMSDYEIVNEGRVTFSGKISPKQFNKMRREISRLEWEDLSILLEQKYSLELGVSYPISAFPEQNKDGSREHYCEEYAFKGEGMVLLYFSLPQYKNDGDIAMFFTIDKEGIYIGETALILDIMFKTDSWAAIEDVAQIRNIDIKEYNGIKWFIFSENTNAASPYINRNYWYNLTTGHMDLCYPSIVEAYTPYGYEWGQYAGGFSTEQEEIVWDERKKELYINLDVKYKIFLLGELGWVEDIVQGKDYLEKIKSYQLQYDFEAMRFYVDCEKKSFELSSLGAITIYDVFREELIEMQYGTEAEKNWVYNIIEKMELEEKSNKIKYIDRPEIHKKYIIVDTEKEEIDSKGILEGYYEDLNINTTEKWMQYFKEYNNGSGNLKKGLESSSLFLNSMIQSIETGNVRVKNYEFGEDISISFLENIETLKNSIVVLEDSKKNNLWISDYIIQMPCYRTALEPEIRKNNRIVWLVLRDKETVDRKNLVKNMWFNLYTQQTDLIYWTVEGEGSKELMTDEKGEVYLQIDADINNGLINSDGAKLYYDFNCMRFYTV